MARRLARVHPGVVLRQHAQRLDALGGRLARGALQRRCPATPAGPARRAAPARRLACRAAGTPPGKRWDAIACGWLPRHGGASPPATSGWPWPPHPLQAFSPLRTLQRGYAIVSEAATGKVIRSAAELQPGSVLHARLGQGSIEATVVKKLP
ncbi:MAG: hypothetical protein M5R42_09850 [Rhodocyclaceae bacterium]|nr:hypothetical protein [Rhodocyclaceae bacterium]